MSQLTVLENFIAIEGLDGAGTTTQAKRVASRLAESRQVHLTCEPTDGEIGRLIRRILRGELSAEPRSVAHLFAADRTDHLYHGEKGIVERLRRGETVITDRYLFSSLAYQSVECGFDFVLRLNDPFPLPRHLIYLDIDPDLGDRRTAGRGSRELYERIAFQREVQELYERALGRFEGNGMLLHRLDGSLAVNELTDRILSLLS